MLPVTNPGAHQASGGHYHERVGEEQADVNGLLFRTMSGPMILPEMGSSLMSLAHVATRDYIDVHGLSRNL